MKKKRENKITSSPRIPQQISNSTGRKITSSPRIPQQISDRKLGGRTKSLHRHEFRSKSAIVQVEQITSSPRIPQRISDIKLGGRTHHFIDKNSAKGSEQEGTVRLTARAAKSLPQICKRKNSGFFNFMAASVRLARRFPQFWGQIWARAAEGVDFQRLSAFFSLNTSRVGNETDRQIC